MTTQDINKARNESTILIDYFEFTKTYELWDLQKDCKYPSREFKSLIAAENYCKRNKLSYKFGISCDG